PISKSTGAPQPVFIGIFRNYLNPETCFLLTCCVFCVAFAAEEVRIIYAYRRASTPFGKIIIQATQPTH
ncbi:MAG: hypothetical protein ACRCTU_17085, partial [Zoogloea sp.]|uniref:hypothetical protein n=1 Tax=Zoogloea sp. TaxID=49181 RepID=UPI003F2C0E38